MKKGDLIIAHMYGGEKAQRRVVKDLGHTVVICNESEYQRALVEDREPQGVGFPRTDVEPFTE